MAHQATDGQPVLQVPRHEFRVVDDGSRETVEITVQLPGVSSAADISVRIEPPQTVTVTVPSRYHLQLVLAVPIASRADTVKFKSKTGRLNMSCRVLTPEEAKAAAAAAAAAGGGAGVPNGNGALGSSSSGGNSSSGALRGVTSDTAQLVSSSSGLSARSSLTGDGSSHGGAAAAAVPPPTPPPPFGSSSSSGVSGSSTWQPSPTPPWHQQQQQQPVPARPSPPRQQPPPPQQQQQPSPPPPRQQQRQQQSPGGVHESFFPQPTKAELRRQQLEEQRRQQEEEQRRREQEAAAAAAAEAQRQREEAAAARRAAEEKKRQEAQRKAAARAAAAEEAQRKEQQRRLNKAAAEEWLSRGHAAIAQEDLEVAAKALSKARELDPTNKDGLHRLNKELAALRQQKAAAAAAAAGSRRSAGSSGDEPPPQEQQPGPGPSSSSNGPQQQQRRRPPWRERRRAAGHGVRDEKTRDMLDKWCEGGHAGGPVGWWCGCVDVLCYWVTWLGAVIADWAAGLPPSSGRFSWAKAAALWVVGMAGTLVMFVPALLLILWHLAWSKPLGVVAAVRRVGGDSHLESVEWMMRWQASLSTKEDLSSGLTKAALAGCSGGAAYSAVWCSCLLPLGSHSLVGWLLALLGWVWRLLLWSPSYTLQFVAAAAGTGFCSYTQPGPCVLALFPLQVLVGGGRWTTLANLAGSILYGLAFRDWRPSWREVSSSPPWWQCVAVAALPTLVLRSLSRAGVSRLFWALLWLLARLAWQGVAAVGSGLGAAVGVEGPLSFLQALGDTLGPAVSWAGPALRPAAWAASKALTALASLAVRTLPAPTTLSLSAWAVGSVCHKPVPAFWKDPCRVVLKAGLLESMGAGNGTATAGAAGAAGAAAGVSSLEGGFPHAWWLDVLLFVWLFYVTAVYTKWEEEFGRDFYREQQQEEQQRRRQQQQQQRGHHAAGSDDEADHTPWGDKQSDFPMGFGAVAVPAGCEVAEVKAVLAATDYYKVMGYASREEVTAESLKTKRRQLVLAVHPDKVGHDYPGANQAAGRVNKAFETLSDPGMRSAYDSILANHSRGRAGGFRPAGGAAGAAAGGGGSEAWAGEYRDDLYDRPSPTDNMFMVQDMGCPGCGGQHTAYILPKAPFGVRWCVDCKTWHPVAKGEIWAHWSPGPMGMSWLGGARLLLCADPEGPVYDVTEVFRCKEAGGILPRSQEFCNRHVNQYMAAAAGGGGSRGYAGGGGGGGGGTSTARRSRKKGKRR